MEQTQEQVDPLDIDKPGYYIAEPYEYFFGAEYEWRDPGNEGPNSWIYDRYTSLLPGVTFDRMRMKYLQAKDIIELGFGRAAQGISMYTRGRVSILTYQLLDPTYAKLEIVVNSVPIFKGKVKNKSELKRILKLNEINFVE